MPMVAQLSETEKQIIFKEDSKKSVAILLHEFVEPKGLPFRNFDTSHAISKSLMKSSGFKHVLKYFFKSSKFLDTTTGLRKMCNYRYVMTPRKGHGSGSIFKQTTIAFNEHIKLAVNPNITQLFLGSYMVDIQELENGWAEINVTNETSRNSLFLHIPPKTKKPNIFGSIYQKFTLHINLNEFYDAL